MYLWHMLQMKSRWASVNPSKPGTRSPEVEEEEVTLPQGADEEGRKAWNSRSWFSIKSWLKVSHMDRLIFALKSNLVLL